MQSLVIFVCACKMRKKNKRHYDSDTNYPKKKSPGRSWSLLVGTPTCGLKICLVTPGRSWLLLVAMWFWYSGHKLHTKACAYALRNVDIAFLKALMASNYPRYWKKHVWIALLGGTSPPTKAFMIVHCTTRNSRLLKGYAGRGKNHK